MSVETNGKTMARRMQYKGPVIQHCTYKLIPASHGSLSTLMTSIYTLSHINTYKNTERCM